ncbi:hypothetical protein [Jatrophihabitans endophyticus]|uniref:hypothetical protein n=1 Tax=Jatrophihabitans endophyticus TaxID=1206085 RepID=UPI001A01DCC6|nr:hypothetical protein [Jatrophihabitans endophyticus]MBE7190508.1 hypothetical protein [Jatrophihabitans endophyticus]
MTAGARPAAGGLDDDLDLGRAAADLRDTGVSWSAIAEHLEESQVYVQRAHAAYLGHVAELAARDQLALFDTETS